MLTAAITKDGLMMYSLKALALAVILVPMMARVDTAAALGSCQPGVFLTVGGNIGSVNDQASKTRDFTEEEFLKLPTGEIATATPWTRMAVFKGPLLTSVLDAVGARGKTVHMRALNDFTADVDVETARKYGVLLAYQMDGQRLQVKDFGPLWAMFPRDAFPDELNTPLALSKYVWQICRIDVD